MLKTSTNHLRKKLSLNLSFKKVKEGKTFLNKQFSSYPFHICKALYLDKGKTKDMATIYMQSSAGGIYKEDLLNSQISAMENTKVHITSQASTIVHECKDKPAKQHTKIICKKNSYLEFMPEPMIMLPNSSLISKVKIEAHKSSNFLIMDSFFPHNFLKKDSYFNTIKNELIIQSPDRETLVIDRYTVDGKKFICINKDNFFHHHIFHGTVIVFCPNKNHLPLIIKCKNELEKSKQFYASASSLPGDIGVSIKILARSAIELKKALNKVWVQSRLFFYEEYPSPRRK